LNAYETLLIFDPVLGEEKIDLLIKKIEEKIKSLGGEMKKTEKWGSKRLPNLFKKAQKMQYVYYVMLFFDAPSALPAELQYFLKVTEDVFRYSVYRAEEKEAALAEIQGVPQPKEEVKAIG